MPQFWKVMNMLFWEGRILQNSAQRLGEYLLQSFFHFSCFEVPPMPGVCNINYLSGKLSDWQIITSMHMYSITEVFITLAVVLTNREMWTVQNATILEGYEYAVLKRKGFAKLTPKAGRTSSTYLLTPELIRGSPYARGLWYHLPFREPIRLTNYNFHRYVQNCRTIHYNSCCIEK